MKGNIFRLNAFVFFVLMAVCLSGCGSRNLIRVGFTAELTGKQSDLAVNLRNGVNLAVEDINAAGGIDGRKIELIVEDDQGTPEGARDAENKLIDAGVVAIIGHLTSSQTVEGYKVAKERGTVLISATSSTALLTGIDDLFFCTTPSTNYLGSELARHITQTRHLSDLAIIYDGDNAPYSTSFSDVFTEGILQDGGVITTKIHFSGKSITDFIPYIYDLRFSNPQAVLIIASPTNAGIIAQQIRLQKWDIPLFAAPWARGDELLRNGGNAVEGLELVIAYGTGTPDPALDAFTVHYVDRYARTPAFTAIYGYETMQVLAAALQKANGKKSELAASLRNITGVDTLTAKISLDAYGDTLRPLAIERIEDGKFLTIATIELTNMQ